MPVHLHELIASAAPRDRNRCLACGEVLPARRRRYCSTDCQQHLLAALNRRTGLLQALRARYATFYFTDWVIMMDVLLYGVAQIHSYMLARSPDTKPVEDFRRLSNLLGNLWWNEKHRTNKRYLAAQQVLDHASERNRPLNAVIPAVLTIPSIKANNLVRLKLDARDLTAAGPESTIKRAYRRQVMRHHPDVGGSRETFLKIQEAYEKLTQWAMRPTFIHQRGFPDKWFYEGAKNRWIKPIPPRKRRRSSR